MPMNPLYRGLLWVSGFWWGLTLAVEAQRFGPLGDPSLVSFIVLLLFTVVSTLLLVLEA